jgi:predicted transcriptional regulator
VLNLKPAIDSTQLQLLPWFEFELFAQFLRNHDSASLVNGCEHGRIIPLLTVSPPGLLAPAGRTALPRLFEPYGLLLEFVGVMTIKERLHQLVDELTDEEAKRALGRVESEHEDPLIVAFRDAPEDDEPLSAEDEEAMAEGLADIAAGQTIPHEEIKRKYGLV